MEPEDVAQDALLKAWRHRASCRRSDAPEAWIAAIVRQEAARRGARASAAPVLRVLESDASQAPDVLEALIPRIDLRRAMQPLTTEDRRLLWLRYGADLTQPAAAAALGLPEGTAKVRLHRLRKRLRAELEDA